MDEDLKRQNKHKQIPYFPYTTIINTPKKSITEALVNSGVLEEFIGWGFFFEGLFEV